jgi:hypothetical protein
MAHVAREVVQPRQASLIPESVHRLGSASGLNPRRAHGIRGLETTTSRFFCSHRQVQPELLFQVSVAPAWKQCSPETVNPFAKEAHAIVLRHASPRSSVWMMPVRRTIRSRIPCGTSAADPALLDALMEYHPPH